MQKADPLISTKLRLPFTRPGLVSRPRLQRQIAQEPRDPLALITAPMSIRGVPLFVKMIGHGYPLLLMHGGPSLDHTTLLPLQPL